MVTTIERRKTKIVHGIPVISVLSRNDGEENIGMHKGLYRCRRDVHFTKSYIEFWSNCTFGKISIAA